MKRITLRTVILAVLCLLLLTGIALAAAGVFGTMDYLRVNTSAPADGKGITVQTQIHQTGGECPDLTATVRDAVYDGATAFVTVEYKLKDMEKYMLLSDLDTFGLDLSAFKKKYGDGGVPLSDPAADPREKLVLGKERVYVYGVNAANNAMRVYEEGGIVVMNFQIQLFESSLLLPSLNSSEGPLYSWLPSAYQVQDWEPFEKSPMQQDIGYSPTDNKELNQRLLTAKERLASSEPLDIKIKVPLIVWNGETDGTKDIVYAGKYYCNVGLTLEKTGDRKEYSSPDLMQKGQAILQETRFTFSNLATYGDFSLLLPEDYGWNGTDQEYSFSLAFDLLDGQGVIIPRLGTTVTGASNIVWYNDTHIERHHYTAWWPAMNKVPESVTLQARNFITGDVIATFDIPLTEMTPASLPSDDK